MNKRIEFGLYIAMFFVFWYYWLVEFFKALTVYPFKLTKIMMETLKGKIMSEYEKDQEILIKAERRLYGQKD